MAGRLLLEAGAGANPMAIGRLLRTMHALTGKLWNSMNTNHQFEYVEGQMRPHHPALLQDFERQGELAARLLPVMAPAPWAG